MSLTWALSGVIGFIMLLFNTSFATLWVGANNFLSQEANFAILIMITQYLLIQNDSVLINVMLDVKSKTLLGLFSIILSTFFAYLFSSYLGVFGFIIGFIVGRLLLSYSYPKIVFEKIPKSENDTIPYRLISIVFILWVIGFLGEDYIYINNWWVLITSIITCFILTTVLIFQFGLTTFERENLIKYLKIKN